MKMIGAVIYSKYPRHASWRYLLVVDEGNRAVYLTDSYHTPEYCDVVLQAVNIIEVKALYDRLLKQGYTENRQLVKENRG